GVACTGMGCDACVAAVAMGACTVRLFTTVFIPATRAASPAAPDRTASLDTVPFSVTTPPETAVCICSPRSAWSEKSLLWTCVFNVASSAVELLQPATPPASATANVAAKAAERILCPFIRSLSIQLTILPEPVERLYPQPYSLSVFPGPKASAEVEARQSPGPSLYWTRSRP